MDKYAPPLKVSSKLRVVTKHPSGNEKMVILSLQEYAEGTHLIAETIGGAWIIYDFQNNGTVEALMDCDGIGFPVDVMGRIVCKHQR
jgi:hypothetical protein